VRGDGELPGGANNLELKGGLLTFTLEQLKPWPDAEPANEIISRVSACLNSIAKNEANAFSPGAKSFRIAIVYQDDPPAEVERALEKSREAASADHGVEITRGGSIPTALDKGRRSPRKLLASR
jgi:hypothetical protein